MSTTYEKYLEIMRVIRSRFEIISQLRQSNIDKYLLIETCAFHLRKIIEGIAFSSLITVEHGIGTINNSIKKQWNAQKIFTQLEKDKLHSFPSPSIIRNATLDETQVHNVAITIEGEPQKRITTKELIKIYNKLHQWNHELNPYKEPKGREYFLSKYQEEFWHYLDMIWLLVEKHVISINGKAFYCVLKDNMDSQVKLISLQK